MLLTLVYFLIALLVLITIHEYGHFLIARCCGVRVLRFSFGFGKVLFRWHDRYGTEYAVSALPLGGYIKMLDENESPVAEDEKKFAFNNQSVFARMAIVLAGPMFNFLFAWFAFWLVSVIGMMSLAPIVESVIPGSIAEQAGLTARQEIIEFNHHPVRSWRDFQYQLIPKLGSDEIVEMKIKSLNDQMQTTIQFPLVNWKPGAKEDPLETLGIRPFVPKIPRIVGDVVKNSVAEQAGLQPNDLITAVNGKPIHDWIQLVTWVQKHPNTPMTMTIKREHHQKIIKLITASQIVNEKTEGMIGLRSKKMSWPKKWLRFERQSPIKAASSSLKQTIDLSSATFMMIGRLITGHLGLNTLSGPIGIAQGAGDSGRMGLTAYLSFMALISISLGVLNLLPIPMLDGGHLFYCFIELITRRPLSEKIRLKGLYFGVVFLAMLMCIAVYNDFYKLLNP